MKKRVIILLASSIALLAVYASASDNGHHHGASDDMISKQREALAKNTKGLGFGPQSPRDIDSIVGKNHIAFN